MFKSFACAGFRFARVQIQLAQQYWHSRSQQRGEYAASTRRARVQTVSHRRPQFCARVATVDRQKCGAAAAHSPIPALATPGGRAGRYYYAARDNTGCMFLYNPTMREINVSLPLSGYSNASLGFTCRYNETVLVKQLTSSERVIHRLKRTMSIWLTVLRVFCHCPFLPQLQEFLNLTLGSREHYIFGTPASTVNFDDSGTVSISGALGESGTVVDTMIVLPTSQSVVTSVVVNGKNVEFSAANTSSEAAAIVVKNAFWAGERFSRAYEVRSESSRGWSGTFMVPQSAMNQLEARNMSYPVEYNTNPEDTNDANVPWLAPGRILIFIKYVAGSIDDTLNVTASFDGQALLVRKAYNTIVRNAGRFIGHWADMTPFVKPGQRQTLNLELPGFGTTDWGILRNVETLYTSSLADQS